MKNRQPNSRKSEQRLDCEDAHDKQHGHLTYPDSPDTASHAAPGPKPSTPAAQLKRDSALLNLLRNAIEAASDDDDDWAALASVGHVITNQ